MINYLENIKSELTLKVKSFKKLYLIDHDECFNDIKFKGNSFQYSILLDVLNRIDNNDTTTKNKLEKKIKSNYQKYGFNYFQNNILPEDLDTASALVRVIKDPYITSRFLELTRAHKNNDLKVSTWLCNGKKYCSEYFDKTLIYKTKDFYHTDVNLNYLITKAVVFHDSIDEELCCLNLTHSYWYYQTHYNIALASKLLPYIRCKKVKSKISEIIFAVLSQKIGLPFTKCNFSHVIKEYNTQQKNNDSWLNYMYLIGTLYNLYKNSYNDIKNLESFFFSFATSFKVKELRKGLPIYWSFNNGQYCSPNFEHVLALNAFK